MVRLRDTISIHSSVAEAESRIESYLSSLRDGNGVARIRLRVPVDLSSRSLGLNIDREVRIEARRTKDDQNLNDIIRITWNPEGRTVFPVFSGSLVVWGEEDPRKSYVELDGTYEPPFDGAGLALDAMIGHRIALSTAHEFLKDIKRAIETE
jgi:hypothetical protein